MANKHDTGYKKLFSNPELVRELIQGYVNEEFVKHLDFNTLERIDKSYITMEFRKKESDLIYRINFQGNEIYIYILMEFQSTVDKFMSLRMLRYICEFYEHLTQGKLKQLPPVFPLLLYNGNAKWTAAQDIRDLIDAHIPEIYIPSFRYFPIIENEIPEQVMFSIKNAVSAIFYVETNSVEEIRKNIQKVVDLLRKERPDIINLFKNWFINAFSGEDETLNKPISNLQELKTMLRESLKEYNKKLIKEGMEKGIQKGKLEGKREGIQEGRLDAKLETAKKMHKLGFSMKDIRAVTGLSISEIEKL